MITNFTIVVDLLRLMLCKRTSPRPSLFLDEYPTVDLININSKQFNNVKTLGFNLVKTISNDASYHAQIDIHYKSDYVGFILTDRTKKYGYNLGIIPFHIDNQALYTLPLHTILPSFLETFDLQVSNISQLDIAIDSNDSLWNLITGYTNRPASYQRIKHKNDKGFQMQGNICETTGKQETSVTFGSKTKLKMYNKSSELLAKPKPHIESFYNNNGLIPQSDVYRAELSIFAKALKYYNYQVVTEDGELLSESAYQNSDSFYNNEFSIGRKRDTDTVEIDLTRLNDKSYLLTLYCQYFPISIRKKDRAKLSKCTEIELIDFNKYPKTELNIMTESKIIDENKIAEKRRVKENIIDYVRTKEILYIQTAADIAIRHDLRSDYERELIKAFDKSALHESELPRLLELVALTTRIV